MILLLLDFNKNAEMELAARLHSLLKSQNYCVEGMELKSLIFNYYPKISEMSSLLFGTLNYFELGMLFSIRYGLPEYRMPDFNKNYRESDPEEHKIKLRFVRASHIEHCDGQFLKLDQLTEDLTNDVVYYPDMDSPKCSAVMDEKYLLEKDDILVTHKGLPKVVSVDYLNSQSNKKFIATQQFFVLKFNTDFLHLNPVNMEFLREIVKIILEEQLSTHYKVMLLKHEDKIKAERNNSKQKDTTTSRSVSSIIPSLTKEVISKVKITIPSLEINQLKMLAFFKAINEVKKETTKMEIEMKKLILN